MHSKGVALLSLKKQTSKDTAPHQHARTEEESSGKSSRASMWFKSNISCIDMDTFLLSFAGSVPKLDYKTNKVDSTVHPNNIKNDEQLMSV